MKHLLLLRYRYHCASAYLASWRGDVLAVADHEAKADKLLGEYHRLDIQRRARWTT